MTNYLEDSKVINELISTRATRIHLFKTLEYKKQGAILLKLNTRIQKEIIKNLNDDEILQLLNPLDPDKATDVLQLLNNKKATKLTEKLNEKTKEKVEFLLKFNPKAAAGLMNLNYIIIGKNTPTKDIINDLIGYEEKNNKFPSILIVENGKLIGELPGSALAIHKSDLITEKRIRKIPTIKFDSEIHKVIRSFVKNPRSKVVVLDRDGSILGIIDSRDILGLVDKHATRDLYGFAGVDKEESALDSVFTKVKFRYKWLIINLGTAFLAASVVGLFENTIAQITLLAIYMPLVAGMGGNAGTQALAVAIRGLVMKEVSLKNSKALILNEMGAGAINGIINGLIVGIIATMLSKNPLFGLVIGVAMVINLITAGFFGAIVPLIMKALKKDPASSATIFITTATDVVGFFIFLGLASIILL